ncbi:MAG: DUF4922 domain-containing protein, partial [Deltaproteobacteria bacterium]|nr:DUF4922 domain-containing protein [Deltaproteobacteria bacterium]
ILKESFKDVTALTQLLKSRRDFTFVGEKDVKDIRFASIHIDVKIDGDYEAFQLTFQLNPYESRTTGLIPVIEPEEKPRGGPAVKKRKEAVEKEPGVRGDFFYTDLEGETDTDKAFRTLHERQAKDGFGFQEYWDEDLTVGRLYEDRYSKNENLKEGFNKHLGKESKDSKVISRKAYGLFRVVKILWRPLRRLGFPGTKLRGDPDAVNDGCFLCIPNMSSLQKGFRIRDKSITLVALCNPFQIVKNHITLASLGHDPHISQQITPEAAMFILEFTGRSKSFKFAFNAMGAGASIDHLHFHGWEENLPIESAGETGLIRTDDFSVNMLDKKWPNVVYVLRGDYKKITGFIIAMAEAMKKRFPDNQEQQAFNIVFTRDDEGKSKVYFIPRRKQKPANFGGNFGFCEMTGLMVAETTKDFGSVKAGRIKQGLAECGYSHKESRPVQDIFDEVVKKFVEPVSSLEDKEEVDRQVKEALTQMLQEALPEKQPPLAATTAKQPSSPDGPEQTSASAAKTDKRPEGVDEVIEALESKKGQIKDALLNREGLRCVVVSDGEFKWDQQWVSDSEEIRGKEMIGERVTGWTYVVVMEPEAEENLNITVYNRKGKRFGPRTTKLSDNILDATRDWVIDGTPFERILNIVGFNAKSLDELETGFIIVRDTETQSYVEIPAEYAGYLASIPFTTPYLEFYPKKGNLKEIRIPNKYRFIEKLYEESRTPVVGLHIHPFRRKREDPTRMSDGDRDIIRKGKANDYEIVLGPEGTNIYQVVNGEAGEPLEPNPLPDWLRGGLASLEKVEDEPVEKESRSDNNTSVPKDENTQSLDEKAETKHTSSAEEALPDKQAPPAEQSNTPETPAPASPDSLAKAQPDVTTEQALPADSPEQAIPAPAATEKQPQVTAEKDGKILTITVKPQAPKVVKDHTDIAARTIKQWIENKEPEDTRLELTLLGPKGRKLAIIPGRIRQITLGSIVITVDLDKIKAENYNQLKVTFSVPQKDKHTEPKIYEGTVKITEAKEKPEAAKEEQIQKLCQELNMPFNKAYLSYSKETLERRVKSLIDKGIAPQDITPILIRYQGYLDTIEENDTSTSHKKKLISNAKKEISGLRQKIKRLTDKEKKP